MLFVMSTKVILMRLYLKKKKYIFEQPCHDYCDDYDADAMNCVSARVCVCVCAYSCLTSVEIDTLLFFDGELTHWFNQFVDNINSIVDSYSHLYAQFQQTFTHNLMHFCTSVKCSIFHII